MREIGISKCVEVWGALVEFSLNFIMHSLQESSAKSILSCLNESALLLGGFSELVKEWTSKSIFYFFFKWAETGNE